MKWKERAVYSSKTRPTADRTARPVRKENEGAIVLERDRTPRCRVSPGKALISSSRPATRNGRPPAANGSARSTSVALVAGLLELGDPGRTWSRIERIWMDIQASPVPKQNLDLCQASSLLGERAYDGPTGVLCRVTGDRAALQ